MGEPLTDRRADPRFPLPDAADARSTLRPGCVVLVVDVSAGGALVEAGRPMRPGARVHLQIVTTERTLAVGARVLRCAVWMLDPLDGVTYRGALQFEDRCDSLWEHGTPAGSQVPGLSRPDSRRGGNAIPAAGALFEIRQHRSMK